MLHWWYTVVILLLLPSSRLSLIIRYILWRFTLELLQAVDRRPPLRENCCHHPHNHFNHASIENKRRDQIKRLMRCVSLFSKIKFKRCRHRRRYDFVYILTGTQNDSSWPTFKDDHHSSFLYIYIHFLYVCVYDPFVKRRVSFLETFFPPFL